ncbi:hypothetical protein TTSV1_gp05 [Thermoproteus tenax spherical virus 1]|uniref:Uncharacterized protein n=1 Tax=Thermoproteus tenax spherical virus 1 TaxID=292639 RepID=Q647F7_9VIRU|nr:hypothetical protein TTSV1_gp05 [Thermoproteus tenax spherical virus 1]AAU25955.1 hypothetical protein [Thermoproteus tenax spherical virus 1]
MPRKKKDELAEAEFGPATLRPLPDSPVLAVIVSPTCPACKRLFKSKSAKYYINKGWIRVMEVGNAVRLGLAEYALSDLGMTMRLATPTYIIFCPDGQVFFRVTVNMFDDHDALTNMVINVYREYLRLVKCKNTEPVSEHEQTV